MSIQRLFVVLVVILHISLLAACVAVNKKAAPRLEIARAKIELAAEYLRKDRLANALENLNDALKYDPESVNANTMIAMVYDRLDQLNLAAEHFDTALENVDVNSTNYGDVHNVFGTFLCKRDRTIEADEHFMLAVNNRLYRHPQAAYENAGQCALKRNKKDKAEEYFQKALKINPRMPGVLFKMSGLKFEMSDYSAAQSYLNRYHKVATEDAGSLLLAIRIEKALGNTRTMYRLADRLRRLYPDSEQVRQIGVL